MILMPIYTFFTHPIILEQNAAELRGIYPKRLNHKYLLKNRLVLAPMTTCQSNSDGSVSVDDVNWLKRTAADGYGMLITCAATVSKDGTGFKNQLSIADEHKIRGLTELVYQLKSSNTVNIIQLSHAGSRADPEIIGSTPYSASSYTLNIPDFVPPIELSLLQIHKVIHDFANGCLRAYIAGFDGIEIHGCNGYLITQFISTMTNQRTDVFGGSLENRARLAREIVKACRKLVPTNFIIGFRLSFENSGVETGLDVDENIQIANWLIEDGIDYLHISGMDYAAKSIKYPEKILLPYIKSQLNHISIIGVGGIKCHDDVKNALELGADLVSIGRAAVGNPGLVKVLTSNSVSKVNLTPYLAPDLEQIGLSAGFISYMKNNLAQLRIIESR
jgi:2,4-dienoyl-CoA reductase-like NADH-dependent reductase (Old Yellow Enzyme family)